MDIILNGIVGGICSVSLVMFPLMFIFGIGSKEKQANQESTPAVKRREVVGIIIMGFAFTLASAIFTEQEAWNRRLTLGIGHIVLIALVFVPVWAFAAFGTGTLDPARSEQDQMRERGVLFRGALVGHALAIVLSAILFLE